jgi:hypothetical protein
MENSSGALTKGAPRWNMMKMPGGGHPDAIDEDRAIGIEKKRETAQHGPRSRP